MVVWNLESHISREEGFKAQVGDENGRISGGGFPSIDESGFLSTKSRVCKQASTAATNGMTRRHGKDAAGSSVAAAGQGSSNKNGKIAGPQESDSWNEISGDDTDRKKKDSKKYAQILESPETMDPENQIYNNKSNKLNDYELKLDNSQDDDYGANFDDEVKSSPKNGQKPKTSKTQERMKKNIANYLHEPKPERRKHSLFKAHIKLKGHTKSVEDLVFKPNSKDILCSVGVDRQVVFWDLRTGTAPTLRLQEVHKSDINTVDWSSQNDNLLATGSNDTLVKILDIRKAYNLIGSSAPKVSDHNSPIVQTLHKH